MSKTFKYSKSEGTVTYSIGLIGLYQVLFMNSFHSGVKHALERDCLKSGRFIWSLLFTPLFCAGARLSHSCLKNWSESIIGQNGLRVCSQSKKIIYFSAFFVFSTPKSALDPLRASFIPPKLILSRIRTLCMDCSKYKVTINNYYILIPKIPVFELLHRKITKCRVM